MFKALLPVPRLSILHGSCPVVQTTPIGYLCFFFYRGLGGGRKASGLRTSFRSPAAHFGGCLATTPLQGHFALFVDIVKSDMVLIFTFLSDVKRSLSALKSKQASRETAKSPAL